MVVEMFHMAHHSLEMVFSILILYATYLALRKFKLIVWKKGFYLIGGGALIFLLVETIELLEAFGYIEETDSMVIFIHTLHILAFPLFAAGIYLLAKTAGKLWGVKRDWRK